MPEIKGKEVVENQINPDKIGFLAPVDDANSTLIQLFVKTLQGKTISTEVEKDALVIAIMEQVAQKTDIPILDQRLQFAGKQLDPALSIQDYALQKENTLHLSVRLDGGMGEYRTVQNFIKAKITHGNVTGLITKESTLAVEYFRNKKYKKRNELTKKKIKFAPGYQDPLLQKICFDSILIEGYHGGNCSEMAKWTAVQLIESTQNQWVYICSLDGTFPLKNNINPTDKKHVLYRKDEKRVSDKFDHVFVVTYPTEVNSIAQMDADKATVVDTWYDHLVCSLKDYKASMHPYYKYPYSSDQALSLEDSDVAIEASFAAVGTPFANNKKVAKKDIAFLKDDIDNYYKNSSFIPRMTKYQFKIDKSVQEKRSTSNLENLLLEAQKINEQVEEANMFERKAFETILQSTNTAALTVLFEAAAGISNEAFDKFCQKLRTVEETTFELFCAVCAPQTIQEFFEFEYSDYATNTAFVNFLDTLFANSTAQQDKILTALPAPYLNHYILSSDSTFARLMTVQSISNQFGQVLSGMNHTAWAALLNGSLKPQVAAIINGLLTLNRDHAAAAILNLTTAQFNGYFRNRNTFDDITSSGINNPVLQAVFTQFHTIGIDRETGKPSSPLSDIYAQKLGSYYWGAYEG